MDDAERKRLEESIRRRRSATSHWTGAGGGRRGHLLDMVAAGGKKFKRDKTNAPCFE